MHPVVEMSLNEETNENVRRQVAYHHEEHNMHHKKSYSNELRYFIIKKYIDDGMVPALKLAGDLEIVPRTARDWISKYNKEETGVLEDGRHNPDPSHHARKLSPEVSRHIERVLEEYCEVSNKTLQQLANDFLLRKLAIDNQIQLQVPETNFGETLDPETYLECVRAVEQDPVLKKKWKEMEIRSESTIGKALRHSPRQTFFSTRYTYKNVVRECLTANSESAKKKRLVFCIEFKEMLMDKETEIVYIDETPMYCTDHRSRGRSRRGTKAVVRTVPGSKFSGRTQIAIACSPLLGIVHSDVYPPHPKKVSVKSTNKSKKRKLQQVENNMMEEDEKHMSMPVEKADDRMFTMPVLRNLEDYIGTLIGTAPVIAEDKTHGEPIEERLGDVKEKQEQEYTVNKTSFKTLWSKEEFLKFLKQVCLKLYERREELKGLKRVFIMYDNASEHKLNEEEFRKEASVKLLEGWLTENGSTLHFKNFPPNSPYLNLVELYNKILKAKCNAERSTALYLHTMLQEVPHGTKRQHRSDVLVKLIKSKLAQIEAEDPKKNYKMHTMIVEYTNNCIREKGYMDYHLKQ